MDAYSRVGCSEPDILDELVGRVSSNPSALSGEALAKLIVAIIRLGGEDQKQLATLLDAVVGKLNEVTPKSIVKMLCALGELGQSHQGLLDAVTERQVPERMSEFSPAGLCDLVNALNKVGYYNSKFMGLLHKQGVAVAAAEGAQAMA